MAPFVTRWSTWPPLVFLLALASLIPATSQGIGGSPLGCVRSKSGPSPGGFGGGNSSTNPSWGFYDISYDCQLRTLLSNLNDSLNIRGDDVRRVSSLRVQCKDALLFESFLSPNQTLFKLANLKSLEISSCKIRRIPSGLWSGVRLLQNLSIQTRNALWSSSYAMELERASFQSLEFLQTLDLSYNNLWSVPEGVFCPLKSLKELKLSRNKLTELEELVGGNSGESVNCSVSKLQSVDLSWNSLRQVVKVTKTWSSLQKLVLNNNLIEQLEDAAFSELTGLQSLNLSSNRLVALPPMVFKLNVNLKQVSLANNSISALAPGVFLKLAGLLVLDLSRNTLNSQWIRGDVFQGLKAIRVLRLSYNQLSVLDAGVFKDLENLQALSLDNNRLETVSSGAFTSLKNLISLDLANNRLVAVEAKMLGALKNLRQLYLDHNKIKTVDENALVNCTSLQDFGLSGNLLQEVPTALRTGLSVLRSLDLGENRIFSVTNESFRGLSQLYGLRMVENRLAELPIGFCDPLKNLRVLNLAQNRLTKIQPSALTSCPHLRALRLDSNLLDHLPQSLVFEVPSLLWLNVSENRVTRADYRLLPGSIEWLDLSHNSLESFGGELSGSGGSGNAWRVSNIRVLDLSYNKLNELKMTMIPRNVETLRVNHNKLKLVFPDTFARLSRIARVELMWNELERVELSSLKLSTRRPSGGSGGSAAASAPPAEFYLTGNPFQCDCSSEWLFQLHQQYSAGPSLGRGGGAGVLTSLPLLGLQYPKVMDLDALACTRSNGSIQLFGESHADDFYCTYKTHCDLNCHCCDFSACDCAMVCPDGCECLHDSAWSRNIVKCGNLFGNGNRSGEVVKDVNRLPMTATEIYLDGNNIPVLTSHSFIGKRFLRRLWLNNSQVQQISNKTFNGLGALEVLRLEDNFLQSVDGFEFAELGSLRELYLQNNLLKFVDPAAFVGLKLLSVLRLDGNLLVSLSLPPQMARLKQVFLAGNPFNCDCEFVIPIRYWMTDRQVGGAVTDVREMHCYSTGSGSGDAVPKNMFDICPVMNERQKFRQENLLFPPHIISNLLPASAGSGPGEEEDASPGKLLPENSQNGLLWTLIVTLAALVMLILALLLIFRKEIYYRLNDGLSSLRKPNSASCCWTTGPGGDDVWNDLQQRGKFEYSNTVGVGGMVGATPRNFLPNDSEKLFDAYFLYSSHDEDVLLEKIVQGLDQAVAGMHDNDNNFYRLCLHYRDLCLSPGNPWNPEMILGACDSSKRIVLVLSTHLIASEWNNKDFRHAITQAVHRHHKRFIVILLPEDAANLNWNAFQAGLQSPQIFQPELPLLKSLGAVTLPMLASMKSSTISFTDVNFWPKMRILLPPPCAFSTAHRRPVGGFNTNNRRQQRYYQPTRKFAASMNNINHSVPETRAEDEPPPLPPPRNPQHQMALSKSSAIKYNSAYSDQEGEYHIYSSLSECPTLPCRSGGRCGAIGAGARHQGPGGPWPPGYCGAPLEQLPMAQLSRVASPGNNRPVMRDLNTGGIERAEAAVATESNKSFNHVRNGANNRGNLLGSDNREINESAKIDNPLEAATSSGESANSNNEAHASLNSVQQQQQQPMYFV